MWTVWGMEAFIICAGTNGGLNEHEQSTWSIMEREERIGDGGNVWVRGWDGDGEAAREWRSQGAGVEWVGADKVELWRINLSWVCFRAGVVEGQALCSWRALDVLSNIQTPCLPSPIHIHKDHNQKHKNNIMNTKHQDTDLQCISDRVLSLFICMALIFFIPLGKWKTSEWLK